MKQTMIVLACLSLLLGATTTQAQDSAKSESKVFIGVGAGARTVTGDSPAPRLGETANLTQFGVHALFAINPKLAIVGDWAYGFRTLKYESTATGGTTIANETKATGWNLNGLVAASLPIGSNGGQLYAGPGVGVINAVFDITQTNNGSTSVTKRDLGTKVGFVVGAGALMPLKDRWHAFFSYRHAWVVGEYSAATTTSSVKADIPVGGPSALVGVGISF
jgi:opacity protein-like surface antigen